MKKIQKLELKGEVIYIDGVEAFTLTASGTKSPLTQAGWEAYRAQQVMVDDWLERQKS